MGHRHGRHKRAGRRPAAQWRPRSHVFLLSPGLCDLLVGALGPAIGRLCAQPGSGGGGGGQGASSLRGPLTQLLQPQTLTPGLREAHQTREQRGGFSTVPPGPRGQRQSLRPSQSGVDSARHRDSRPQTERSLGRGLPRGGGREAVGPGLSVKSQAGWRVGRERGPLPWAAWAPPRGHSCG